MHINYSWLIFRQAMSTRGMDWDVMIVMSYHIKIDQIPPIHINPNFLKSSKIFY